MNPQSESKQAQFHSYIFSAKDSIVQKLIKSYGQKMYDYQQKLLERYMKCRQKQQPSCNKYQQHPIIKLQRADNNFMACIDTIKRYSDINGAIGTCVKEYESNAAQVFDKQFLKCQQLLKEY